MLPLVATVKVNVSKGVSTRPNRSITKAYEDYKKNKRPQLAALRNTYAASAYNKAMNDLNARFGYSPTKYTVWMKEMRSDKHPEFEMWNNACMAAKTLLSNMRYNKSITDIQSKCEPIVGYFQKIYEGIPEKDRKQKGLKKAAYNNMINLMYHLDQMNEVVALCESMREDKVLGKSSKKMLSKAYRKQALMAFHNVETCHMEEMADVDEADAAADAEEEEEAPEADEDGQN